MRIVQANPRNNGNPMFHADPQAFASVQRMADDRAIGMNRNVLGRGGTENFHSVNVVDKDATEMG